MSDIQEKHQESYSKGCSTVTYQSATVSVPVSVKPKVCTGKINSYCCGEPQIFPKPDNSNCCCSDPSCNYIIRQNFCIEIPIEIDAKVSVDSPYIECGDPISVTYDHCG